MNTEVMTNLAYLGPEGSFSHIAAFLHVAGRDEESGGLLTPQLRHIIGQILKWPDLRPASLAMLYTRFVRSERNYEHQHRLCKALKLLGRLMNPGTPSDSRAIVLPKTFTTETTFAPFSCATRTAARVSAVSPD